MRLLPFLLVLIGALSPMAWGKDFIGRSPNGSLGFCTEGGRKFFMWSTASPKVRVLVYPKGEDLKAIAEIVAIRSAALSRDEDWLVMEMGDSASSAPLFLKRKKGFDYEFLPGQFFVEDKSTHEEPTAVALSMALKARQIDGTFDLIDHAHLRPLGWSPDSHWVMLSLDAKGKANGKQIRITGFEFRYNPETFVMEVVPARARAIEIDGK